MEVRRAGFVEGSSHGEWIDSGEVLEFSGYSGHISRQSKSHYIDETGQFPSMFSDGQFKLLHLWAAKFPQAGRADYVSDSTADVLPCLHDTTRTIDDKYFEF